MAAGNDRINQHRLIQRQTGDTGADFGHRARRFVAHHHRIVHPRVAARVDFQIRPAKLPWPRREPPLRRCRQRAWVGHEA